MALKKFLLKLDKSFSLICADENHRSILYILASTLLVALIMFIRVASIDRRISLTDDKDESSKGENELKESQELPEEVVAFISDLKAYAEGGPFPVNDNLESYILRADFKNELTSDYEMRIVESLREFEFLPKYYAYVGHFDGVLQDEWTVSNRGALVCAGKNIPNLIVYEVVFTNASFVSTVKDNNGYYIENEGLSYNIKDYQGLTSFFIFQDTSKNRIFYANGRIMHRMLGAEFEVDYDNPLFDEEGNRYTKYSIGEDFSYNCQTIH